MNSFLIYALQQAIVFEQQEKEVCAEFTRCKEKAREKYWDACKYPRKTKKKMRKEALADFNLYSILEQPISFKQ